MRPYRRIGHSNTSRCIHVNDLNIITSPLNQELVQGRRYAGMNPIPPQDNAIITLYLGDEERGSQSLAPYSQLHRSNPLSSNRITTTNAIDHHIGLDQLFVELAHLLEGVWHQVDYHSSINEHPSDRCVIMMPLDVQ
jgi:hypothetical protein